MAKKNCLPINTNQTKQCDDHVQEHGVETRNIMFLNLVCCPEGLKAMAEIYPEIPVITGAS
jgi:uracil phosphoribosyltransferase